MNEESSCNRVIIDADNVAIQRDESVCKNCGLCKMVCNKMMGVDGEYDCASAKKSICIHCGQCVHICPFGALKLKSETGRVWEALKDPEKKVVFSVSPAVRVAFGEMFGMVPGTNVEGKVVTALRLLGAFAVLDTTFSADLTILEEASELLERIKSGKNLPQFTSCCPAWVRYAETFVPEYLDNLSSARSPIGMQGAMIKTYFAKKKQIQPSTIFSVAVTPCTAKKAEIRREEMNKAGVSVGNPSQRDMDAVITVRELFEMVLEAGINFKELADAPFDSFMGRGSGAGVIFGNTGGVMEAALRTAYFLANGKEPPAEFLKLSSVRGEEGVREAEVDLGITNARVAVIFGTQNAKTYLEKNQNNLPAFIEVMACPNGCVGGGGQPKLAPGEEGDAVRHARVAGLYAADDNDQIKCSHNNKEVQQAYREFLKRPLSDISKQLLHTQFVDRSQDLGVSNINKTNEKGETKMKKFVCSVCGYVHTGDSAPEECPICKAKADKFVEQKSERAWAAEHVVGVANGVPADVVEGLRANFQGECTEVGMYLAMARVAHREGYPEVGMYYEKAAMEEAEHAAKFAELLGEVVTASTKKNLELRVEAENGATAGKVQLATRAKELGLDAIHDTVHEMARDEARHGKAFEGLLNRYFK